MKKILIIIFSLLPMLTGCSSWEEFSLVHSPDIEQGNIITPEMVALLEPGMSKRQVRYALGTPMLIDVFHQQRWDYLFTVKRRNEPMEIKHYSLYFEGDRLSRFGGDIEPASDSDSNLEKKELLVNVPDYDGDLGILERLWHSLGFGKDE
ncbi:MAG: outer membrane protein assembly factor BamE [Candidatus Thiodiazotropha sp. (ex Lucina aurantia)]|uniref:Outer membrane protein assembly factor BamE n=2 Tax=Candidatus Thiodiazotropha TaxID=1913444 RepID=A0A7Z0VNU2_9GAMM|nr:outer membrane protein assembly factor BamE [Candidatus Thiodiazotropha endolucinida]MBT3011452.1 outer membrane protein assembly factor BamE [Candidatus Thiodiazotropha sp. (ex Lucina pensylvanica)]MBT3014990.1 outer membrane protein assembly factor BamE [Candidatus Thiodiazotropha taylori]MBT3038409.1 outer membrane protein assembly factor BamE [Candidatus Thiodiazotropha sp. (ex Codakia orbicularis)]MBV2102900.1 outer membrane protein assembly factor BamE [Candidatus Thiodiazotropha sp. (